MKAKEYDEEYGSSLEIADLIFIFLRRWKLIALTTIPVVLLGIAFTTTIPTMYRAETSLMVAGESGTGGVILSDMALNQQLVSTYLEIAKSKVILRRVRQKFDLKQSEESLAANIFIAPVGDTEIIKLSYKNADPHLAAVITNEIAQQFISRVNQVMKIRNISILEKAEIPKYPLPKNKKKIVIASFILGVSLGVGLILVIELIFSKVRKPADIERILKAPMLGMIPEFHDIVQEEKENE